jgi:hypothetical protein
LAIKSISRWVWTRHVFSLLTRKGLTIPQDLPLKIQEDWFPHARETTRFNNKNKTGEVVSVKGTYNCGDDAMGGTR